MTAQPRPPEPWQLLHDNGFSWDDVNAIAAILDHHDLDILPERPVSLALDALAMAKAYHETNCPRQRQVAYHSCPHRDAHVKSMTKLRLALIEQAKADR